MDTTTLARPIRTSRTKAPGSYREDLKAVLRADARREAEVFREQDGGGKGKRKRRRRPERQGDEGIVTPPPPPGAATEAMQGPLEAEGAGSTGLTDRIRKADSAGSGRDSSADTSGEGDDVQLVGTNMVVDPQRLRDGEEEKASSFDVRGTVPHTRADAKPHPFFTMKRERDGKVHGGASEQASTSGKTHGLSGLETTTDGHGENHGGAPTGRKSKGKAVAVPPPPLPPMRREPPTWSLFAQKPMASSSSAAASADGRAKSRVPIEPAWPSNEEAHVRNLWPNEVAALEWVTTVRLAVEAGIPPCPFAKREKIGNGTGKGKGRMQARTEESVPDFPLARLLFPHGASQPPRPSNDSSASKLGTLDFVKQQIDLSGWSTTPINTLPAAFQRLLRCIEDRGQAGKDMETPPNGRSSQHLLTHHWRPVRADQCLGNEAAATYLRDWLQALQVSAPVSASKPGSSSGEDPSAARTNQRRAKRARHAGAERNAPRRPIQKRVDKRRARAAARRTKRGYGDDDDGDDGSDDFIVDDSEEEEAWFEQFRRGGSVSTAGDEGDGTSDDELIRAARLLPPSSSEAEGLSQPSAQAADHTSAASAETAEVPQFTPSTALSNCLLISGASGSGKTAAVYACAAELGYEVFELYPGMGRRSGKDLLGAVGDLGRNHMVSSGGSGGGATWRRGNGTDAAAGAPATTPAPTQTATATATVRQSLILVEEADVLYDEDKGFWTAVVELVAESRRPVVVTCNDVTMIPLLDLPLQTHLHFYLPPARLAVPYLQLLAAAEGTHLGPNSIHSILTAASPLSALSTLADGETTSTTRFPPPDGPLHPAAFADAEERAEPRGRARWIERVDLRQAIGQVGFWSEAEPVLPSSSGPNGAEEARRQGGQGWETLRTAVKEREVLSELDARLTGGEEDDEVYGPSPAVQLFEQQIAPHMSQLVPTPSDVPPDRTGSSRFRTELRTAACNLLRSDTDGHAKRDEWRVHEQAETVLRRRAVTTATRTMLRLLRPPPSVLPPRREAILDYAPYLRAMNSWDEAEHRAHEEAVQRVLAEQASSSASSAAEGGDGRRDAGGQQRRMTRNSARFLTASGRRDGGYVRWLPFGPEERAAAERSALDGW